jgi:hypothetical protein
MKILHLRITLTSAHPSFVSIAPEVAGLLVPSKLYGILAAGVPVIYIGPPEGRGHDVVSAGAGVGVGNGDVDGLAAAMRMLRDSSQLRAQMATRAGTLYETRFHAELALEKYHRLTLDTRVDCPKNYART